jgi:DNA-binding transcriptional ArsR family regulator
VDDAGESLGGRLDVGQGDERVGGLGHAAEYRMALPSPRGSRQANSDAIRVPSRSHNLRVCANTDTVVTVLDYLPVSAEPDRERYAAVGRALADPKRLCVLESLAIGELSVSDLSTRVGCQVPNMSQHLAVLRRAGLVTSRRDGNTILYRLTDDRVLEAYRLIQDIAR